MILINFLLSILSGVISGVLASLITHRFLKKDLSVTELQKVCADSGIKKNIIGASNTLFSAFADLKRLKAGFFILSQNLSPDNHLVGLS